MPETDDFAKIRELFTECYQDRVQLPAQIDGNGFSGMNLRLFGEVWGDPALSFRDKRLVVLGLLAGLGANPSLFSIHVRSAIGNGELDATELRAMLKIILYYAGTPQASTLYLLLEELLAKASTGEPL